MISLPLMFLFASPLAATPAPRQHVPLAAWQFSLARPAADWTTAPALDSAAWTTVAVPHTWNAQDGQDGSPGTPGGDYHRGDGFYRTSFVTDAAWAGRSVFVEFDAANRFAEVWLNGARLGEHAGGHARFRFDLTAHLAPAGSPNLLAVRVNNEIGGIIPAGGDFTQFGGLYRPARLVVAAPTRLALRDLGSPGVYLTTRELTAARARIEARVLLENDAASAAALTLAATVFDDAGREVARASAPVSLAARASTEATLPLELATPRRWHARRDPHLYRVRVALLDGLGTPQADPASSPDFAIFIHQHAELDALDQPLGLRTVRVDAQRGFFLNDEPFPLRGVSRHQDRQDKGYALSLADEQEDLALIAELGANAIRLSHYQHSSTFHALCDAAGLLLYAEVGYVARPVLDDEFHFSNAEQQLRELIRQNYNHPAIVVWGLGNETDHEAPALADRLLVRLAAIARAEDPHRLTTYASHHSDADPRNFRSDLIGFNKYYGWYGGQPAALGAWLDAFHAAHPALPIGLSEYGAGASIYQHETDAPQRATRSPWHPEEWQSRYHEENWALIAARPWLWGTFVWNMFDFAADHRAEGDTLGRNDKGLVTYDRRTRKDAFYFYKAHWNPEPLIHIVSHRHSLRHVAVTALQVYSNCATVEAWLDERPLGVQSVPPSKIVRWENLTLAPGPNRLRVRGTHPNGQVSASCSWVYLAGTPYRPRDGASNDYTPWVPPET